MASLKSITSYAHIPIGRANLMNWSYGLTTVESRKGPIFEETLKSLQQGGFESPILFVDGPPVSYYSQFNLPTVYREKNLRTYGHWILTLLELYVRNPNAQLYAIFQDDFVTYRNLRLYLEQCVHPTKSYLNLYTFPENYELVPDKNEVGWFSSNQLGKGAVALVFNRDAVVALLSQQGMYDRMTNPHRGFRAVDGGIVTAMNKAGFKEMIHNPSLVQHTGIQSSMGNKRHPLAPNFLGENFNALNLLPPRENKRGLGDRIERALQIVGITPEAVTAWTGEPCNCEERKQKLNQLGNWAARILLGKVDNAATYLSQIIGASNDIEKI